MLKPNQWFTVNCISQTLQLFADKIFYDNLHIFYTEIEGFIHIIFKARQLLIYLRGKGTIKALMQIFHSSVFKTKLNIKISTAVVSRFLIQNYFIDAGNVAQNQWRIPQSGPYPLRWEKLALKIVNQNRNCYRFDISTCLHF